MESEVSKGSKFFFTITSQISQSSIESTLSKISPFAKRTILFVDTLRDTTGVVDRIKELGLRPFVVHQVVEVADKERCPHIDTIVVDSLSVVRISSLWRLALPFMRPFYRLNLFANTNIFDISPSSSWPLQCPALIVCRFVIAGSMPIDIPPSEMVFG